MKNNNVNYSKYDYLRITMSEEEVNEYIHKWMFQWDMTYQELQKTRFPTIEEKKRELYKHKQDLLLVLKRKEELTRKRNVEETRSQLPI